MAYTQQTWNSGVAGGTPISAPALTHIENGLALATQYLGTGTAFPTTNLGVGDTYFRSDLGTNGSLWTYVGGSSGASGWVHKGVLTCTSTTRPSVVYAGLQIFETDTKYAWQYNGSAWSALLGVPMSGEWSGPSTGGSNATVYNFPTPTTITQRGGMNATMSNGAITLPAGIWLMYYEIDLSQAGVSFTGRTFVGASGYFRCTLADAGAGETSAGASATFVLSAATSLTFQYYITASTSPQNSNHILRLTRIGAYA